MPTTGSSGHVQPSSQPQHEPQRQPRNQPRSQPQRQPRSQLQGVQEPGVEESFLGLSWKPCGVESLLGLLLPRRASSSFLGLLRDASTEGFLAPTNADEYFLCWAIQAQPRA